VPVPPVLPPLSWDRVLTAWRPEPAVLVPVLVLGAAYLLLVRRQVAWPAARTRSFLAGLATVLLVGCSFLGVYGTTLFWARATQNTLLLMVAPLFLALGSPVRLVADALPATVRAPLSRALHGRVARALTFPLVITVVLVVPLLVLYLSPLYALTLRSALASGVAGTLVALTGFTYYWSRFRIDPTPRTDSYLVTVWITVVEMFGDAVLGIILWLGPLVAAGWYALAANGLDPRVDQSIGAGILWIGGDVVGLPFILIVLARMSREDAGKAAQIDAVLDAEDAARAALEPEAPARLWWEDDPQLAERFRRR
jgi:cytochrome c oxidase assembly factor CtaG